MLWLIIFLLHLVPVLRLVLVVHYQQVDRAPASTADVTSVSADDSSVSILASNADRLGVLIFNDSQANLYLKYGTSASTSSFTVKIPAGAYWEMPDPVYTGALTGVWDSVSGAARITELS